jgi:broad specificity phosphatase PhoE
MARLNHLLLVRHGETVGNSSVRFHGRGDVALSEHGRAQMREVRDTLAGEWFDLVVASPLRRSWEGARIVSGGAPVRVDDDLREIDFGRWEGMTAEEIEASDPILYRDWQEGAPGFVFPGGEPRKDLEERVHRALDRLLASGARSALMVLHKGPIRAIGARLLGEPLPQGEPGLGGTVELGRTAADRWRLGRRSSEPGGPGPG